jgi:hypothetical protein
MSSHEEEDVEMMDQSAFDDGLNKDKARLNTFNYDTYFSKQKILLKIAGDVLNREKSATALDKIPKGFEHEINFTTYSPKAVYYYASNLSSL